MDLSGWLQELLTAGATRLRWPWLSVLAASPLVGLAVWWLRRDARAASALHVSHVSRLLQLPRYRTLVRRRLWASAVRGLAALLAVAGCLLIVARPSTVVSTVSQPSRDLIMCLDVSMSMDPINEAVVRAVRQVVESLPGDRVGLTVFNGQSVAKFPLTEDRAFVADALDEAQRAFERREGFYYVSTFGPRSSQLGDGLHSCVRGFDRLEERRGRVVLVVSDNEPFGPPVHELDDVGRQARDRDVVVHALGPPWMQSRPEAVAEFKTAAEATGGSFALLDDEAAVADVVERIDAIERKALDEPPREVLVDRPHAGVLVATVGASVLGLFWFRRRP